MDVKSRYLCIHGHFYQPSRENPWLEKVEVEDTAAPYHDWNERITTECYGPNASARVLDGTQHITKIVNNYSLISFNFGPTLFWWMESNAPYVYRAILEADEISKDLRTGHGNAIAQIYNHLIMPLANYRDKVTEIRWGIADFKNRFNREPEGMWLSETAVDSETLMILADHGIRFTILSPSQAEAFRPVEDSKWILTPDASIDPSRAYRCSLPGGLSISLFFYDSPISRAVAFERLLNDGFKFAERLMSGFSDRRNWTQLLHIATDGESYGHHHKFGEMALIAALEHIQFSGLAQLTNYGEFLEKFPPVVEAKIREKTSWSCAHGVGRWERNCGCKTQEKQGWSQEWRKPVRDVLNWLRDQVAGIFQREASQYLREPWRARDEYSTVLLNRNNNSMNSFLDKHSLHPLQDSEKEKVIKLLEMQRNSLMMFTSCGWFFDDVSGIETIQNFRYAARTIQLAKEYKDLEPEFMTLLEQAKSNIPEYKNGKYIYERHVKTVMVNLMRVVAHYAIDSLFEQTNTEFLIYAYRIKVLDYRKEEYGSTQIAVGSLHVRSTIDWSSGKFVFAVLHFGGHDFLCGVVPFKDSVTYRKNSQELLESFQSRSLINVVHVFDRCFGSSTYDITSMFVEERRSILNEIIKEILEKFGYAYRSLFDENKKLMEYLRSVNATIPKAFQTAVEYTLNQDLENWIQQPDTQFSKTPLQNIFTEARKWYLSIQNQKLQARLQDILEKRIASLSESSTSDVWKDITQILSLTHDFRIPINLWETQNIFLQLYRSKKGNKSDNIDNQIFNKRLKALGKKLNFNMDKIV